MKENNKSEYGAAFDRSVDRAVKTDPAGKPLDDPTKPKKEIEPKEPAAA